MKRIILLFSLFSSFSILAQNNLLSLLDDEDKSIFSSYIFKGTKVVNGQSVELPSEGVLQFNIQHRFGPLNSGGYNLYGLDYAQVRFSLEYGWKDWISLGIGRSSVSKTIDGNIKIRYKRQVRGNQQFPFSVVSNSAIYLEQLAPNQNIKFLNQLTYANQLLLARKINRNLSIQLSPTYIHYNAVDYAYEANNNYHDNFSLGLGGRYKITNRISVNVENFIQLYRAVNNNVLSFGFDIETGGHIFQLHLSNSPNMIEPKFITRTQGELFKGDIYFGFNISRVFTIK